MYPVVLRLSKRCSSAGSSFNPCVALLLVADVFPACPFAPRVNNFLWTIQHPNLAGNVPRHPFHPPPPRKKANVRITSTIDATKRHDNMTLPHVVLIVPAPYIDAIVSLYFRGSLIFSVPPCRRMHEHPPAPSQEAQQHSWLMG